jgi:trk system potassium uptake protein TrkH
VEEDTVRGVSSYFILYILVFVFSIMGLLLIERTDLLTAFTAVTSCMNNVGPGLGEIGFAAGGSFGGFTIAGKLLLSFNMLVGRLELFPILILFLPSAWSKK